LSQIDQKPDFETDLPSQLPAFVKAVKKRPSQMPKGYAGLVGIVSISTKRVIAEQAI
jgi:hypothetical protein